MQGTIKQRLKPKSPNTQGFFHCAIDISLQ